MLDLQTWQRFDLQAWFLLMLPLSLLVWFVLHCCWPLRQLVADWLLTCPKSWWPIDAAYACQPYSEQRRAHCSAHVAACTDACRSTVPECWARRHHDQSRASLPTRLTCTETSPLWISVAATVTGQEGRENTSGSRGHGDAEARGASRRSCQDRLAALRPPTSAAPPLRRPAAADGVGLWISRPHKQER